MKFSSLREDLLNAVQTVQYSANAKGMMPILSGMKIECKEEGLIVHATDLESYTVTSCTANVEMTGDCVVSLKVLMDVLRDSRDEKVDVEVVGNEMVIRGQKSTIKLFTMPVEDFPNVPVVDIPVLEEMEREIVIPSIQKVARAASKDEKRPTLLGILLEIEEDGIKMVSTDSYRLAIRTLKEGFVVKETGQYIVPSSALANFARIAGRKGKINMYRDENRGQVRFDVGESNYIIRLIEGKFPKYGQFIPEKLEKSVEVDKEEMLGALKRASLISSTIKMNISSEGINITSESREIGEGRESVAVDYVGEEMEIAFNGRFLEDGVQSIDGEKVEMGITEPLKPGIIKEKGMEGFMYIIMPIRL
jgi:DNA polymerase III subunit beta